MLRPSARHGCGACPGGWERFFFWGQPWRHLFLKMRYRQQKPPEWQSRKGRMRRRAYTEFLVQRKRVWPKSAGKFALMEIKPMILSGFGPITLTTTLCLTAAAAVINFWLGMRIGKIRHARKIGIGDGGDAMLIARMRAQANFIENTPLALILFGLVELAGKGSWWLPLLGAVFMLGRVAHAFGMDGNFKPGRPFGTMSAYLIQIGLSVVAVLIAVGKF
jgi:uncharacterized membrane protein YecN with MAPEG domain